MGQAGDPPSIIAALCAYAEEVFNLHLLVRTAPDHVLAIRDRMIHAVLSQIPAHDPESFVTDTSL